MRQTQIQTKDNSTKLRAYFSFVSRCGMEDTPFSATWGKIAARPVSLLMILHKCHEYFAFCDDLSDLMNRISHITEGDVVDERHFSPASEIAYKAHSLLVSLGDVSPTVLEHVQELAQYFSEIAVSLNVSEIPSHLQTIRQMVVTCPRKTQPLKTGVLS